MSPRSCALRFPYVKLSFFFFWLPHSLRALHLHLDAEASSCIFLHLASQLTVRRLHLITMLYILHPHRRTERVDASPTLWLTTKLAEDAHFLCPF